MVFADGDLDGLAGVGAVVDGGDEFERLAGVGEGRGDFPAALQRLVEAGELAGVVFELGLEFGERGIDFGLQGGGVGGEFPRIAGAVVGARVALCGELFEDEAVPRNLVGAPEGDGGAGKRAVGQLEGDGGAVLDFDGVHARGAARVEAGDGAVDIRDHVVRVDGVGEAAAAEFGRPFAAPGDGVIVVAPAPRGLDVHGVRAAGEPAALEELQLLQAVAVAILEDGQDASAAALFHLDEQVHVAQRGDERLFANDVFAGGEHLLDLREVQVRRGGEVDDVNVRIGAQRI